MTQDSGAAGRSFSRALSAATGLPGVRVDRDAYLQASLSRHCSEEQVQSAIRTSPATAGISLDVISKIADDSIRNETGRATVLSAAAGMPGALAMVATIPADMAQYMAHMLRISQKLAYLYSWPSLFPEDGSEMDDGTQGMLTLFVGVMMGAHSANAAIGKISALMGEQILKELPKKALTKGVVYPVVKKVAGSIGVQMTKQTFAKGISKAVPIVGGAVSGAVTMATFTPMAKRLKRHLASLELARPNSSEQSDTDFASLREGTV